MSEQLYREQIIDHYKKPHNSGELEGYTHEAELKNLSCGDEIKIQLKIRNSNSEAPNVLGLIDDIRFTGRGCAVCIAATSLLTDEVKGKTVDDVLKMKFEDVQELIGVELSPSRIKCAHLGLLTLQKAISACKFIPILV